MPACSLCSLGQGVLCWLEEVTWPRWPHRASDHTEYRAEGTTRAPAMHLGVTLTCTLSRTSPAAQGTLLEHCRYRALGLAEEPGSAAPRQACRATTWDSIGWHGKAMGARSQHIPTMPPLSRFYGQSKLGKPWVTKSSCFKSHCFSVLSFSNEEDEVKMTLSVTFGNPTVPKCILHPVHKHMADCS